MIWPDILTRVEESSQTSAQRVEARDVWPFVKITIVAREGEIVEVVRSAMLFGDDVFDLKRGLIPSLMNPTVFAPTLGASPDSLPNPRANQSTPSTERNL